MMAYVSFIFVVLLFVSSLQGEYLFLFDNPDIFERCPSESKDVLGFEEMFDVSEFTTTMENDITNVSGNLTVSPKWKSDPDGKIVVHMNAYHWEVGVWQPTIFNLAYRDFCKAFYNPKEYWYTYFSQYITNADEVKDKCLHYPGTKLILKPYDVRFIFKATGTTLSGRYKIEIVFEAFDKLNEKLPVTVCFTGTGEFVKLKNLKL